MTDSDGADGRDQSGVATDGTRVDHPAISAVFLKSPATALKLPGAFSGPLRLITRSEGYSPGMAPPRGDLATLPSKSTHRIVAGGTPASLVYDQNDAARPGWALRAVVPARPRAGLMPQRRTIRKQGLVRR